VAGPSCHMFAGAPLPLSPDVSLTQLLALASNADPLGAWVRACRHHVRIYQAHQRSVSEVLASSDLGLLLRRCAHVVLREGRELKVLRSEALIHWRALQVATATPYLPGLEKMAALFPRLLVMNGGFRIPLHTDSAEEVLARCVSEGLRVTGSRIVYSPLSSERVLPVIPRPP
jgi:hypothetical protein